MRGLVTLPCLSLSSTATFRATDTAGVVVDPPHKLKARRAAELALEQRFREIAGGELTVSSNIPERLGMGSSTADVVAAIHAVSVACGGTPARETIATLAVRAETASDSTMFDSVVLFAQRDGVVLESFTAAFPQLLVVGCNTAPGTGGVDTLTLTPAWYDDPDLARFEMLLEQLRGALLGGDMAALGAVATESARINQRHLAKPHFDQLLDIATNHGAAGVQVSHSGPIAGLLFDPGIADADARAASAEHAIRKLGLPSWQFRAPNGAIARADRDGIDFGAGPSHEVPGSVRP